MMKDKLVEGYGFIGTEPNTLYKFGNGKYKTFEGTEIVAENCLKAKIKDLVVEGKTIQDTEDLSNIESVTERENNILSAKINDNTTTLNLPIPLRSLPNGVCDTIEGNKLVQRVGKIMFDGSADESWGNGYISDGINNRFQITKRIELDESRYGSRPGYCDHFSVVINNSIPPVGSMRMTFTKEAIYFLFNPSTDIVPLENLSAWKTWLSENPVTVYYELETPIVHDLEIPSISTTKGTNVITTENNIKPKLSMKVKVKK